MLWKISFWGGGDFKLFISMGFALSFLDLLDLFAENLFLNNFAFNSQIIFYPKIFSILFNSIILSFPIIFILMIIKLKKENDLSLFYLIFNNPSLLLQELSSKSISIDYLKEEMILEKYYFNNSMLFDLFKEIENTKIKFIDFNQKSNYLSLKEDINLKFNEDDLLEFNFNKKRFFIFNKEELGFIKENILNFNLITKKNKEKTAYYFKSSNLEGLTKEDIKLIKILYKNDLINSEKFRIKLGIPFVPSLTAGFIVFLLFGDLIYMISILI